MIKDTGAERQVQGVHVHTLGSGLKKLPRNCVPFTVHLKYLLYHNTKIQQHCRQLIYYSGMVIHTQQKNVGATVPRFAPSVNILRAPMKKRPKVRFISSDVA